MVFELGLLENLGLRCESRLVVLELAFELVTLHLLLLVLLLDELVLLTVVAQDDDIRDNLRAQLRELIVSLFNFFVQRLVFDFQLFKIDQVQAIRQLLLLP